MRGAARAATPELSNQSGLFFKIGDGCKKKPGKGLEGVLLYSESNFPGFDEADTPILKKSYSSCFEASFSRFSLRFSIIVFWGFFLGSLGCLLFSAIESS
jgi:hypothetical protein